MRAAVASSARRARRAIEPPGERLVPHARQRSQPRAQDDENLLAQGPQTPGLRRPRGSRSHGAARMAAAAQGQDHVPPGAAHAKGDIQGPPYVMPDDIELTFLRKFIERQAAGIPHNPRLETKSEESRRTTIATTRTTRSRQSPQNRASSTKLAAR